ncbi:MAG TPA: hypothetical protein VMB85_08275 [Bryobacteraceae bacterium]|nr:hypothetical protein [Bryobacteraceae bacterium]
MGLVFQFVHFHPVIGAAHGFFPRDTVSFLKLPDQLIALAVNLIEVIVGQLTPLLFHRTFHLFPLSCDLIPIHSLNTL